mgnify:CR=1 FL=1|jgi:hypothetical protein
MKTIKHILNKYRWDFIGVWSLLLAMCIGSLYLVGTLILTGYKHF